MKHECGSVFEQALENLVGKACGMSVSSRLFPGVWGCHFDCNCLLVYRFLTLIILLRDDWRILELTQKFTDFPLQEPYKNIMFDTRYYVAKFQTKMCRALLATSY